MNLERIGNFLYDASGHKCELDGTRVTHGGPLVWLTDEQKAHAMSFGVNPRVYSMANKLKERINDGKNWFTLYDVANKELYNLLETMVELKVITKHENKSQTGFYYKETMHTNPWCNTVISNQNSIIRNRLNE
jgi:hypothetical protein